MNLADVLKHDGYGVSPDEIRKGFEKLYAGPLGDEKLHRDMAMSDLMANNTQHRRAAKIMVDLGILNSTLEYGTKENGLASGRHYHYRLAVPRLEALPVLEEAIAWLEEQKVRNRSEGGKKHAATNRANAAARRAAKVLPTVETAPDELPNGIEPPARRETPFERDHREWMKDPAYADGVALAKKDIEEIRAVAGPEPTSPFAALTPLRRDEAIALIASADQYLNRTTVLAEQFEKLREAAAALGITIDIDKVMEGAQFSRDERLESVALLVPHIKGLHSTIERLTREKEEYRLRAADYDNVRRERDRNAARLRDLTSARAISSQQAAARAEA